ncbi:MAG: carbonic anhydrase [Gammaproteobacteria bacterium]|nr:carbonic anhydrase [Gammaproteobacteria bacterium]
MGKSFKEIIAGYSRFREKYTSGDASVMQDLADHGQQPKIMVVACADSRVDPALILQCDPGDLFVVRNVANIVPPYEADSNHHGTSAALEYGICYLNVRHLVILGHSQCGGIDALLHPEQLGQDDFISCWVSLVNEENKANNVDDLVKQALTHSHQNCLSFPWIKQRVEQNQLSIHRWFFDIKQGQVSVYSTQDDNYQELIKA